MTPGSSENPVSWSLSRGRGSAGRASPCQGEGRGFESRRPLGTRGAGHAPVTAVEGPRGEATACKAVYTGSNPVSTSRAISSVGERCLDTAEATGSNPVSPTLNDPNQWLEP